MRKKFEKYRSVIIGSIIGVLILSAMITVIILGHIKEKELERSLPSPSPEITESQPTPEITLEPSPEPAESPAPVEESPEPTPEPTEGPAITPPPDDGNPASDTDLVLDEQTPATFTDIEGEPSEEDSAENSGE